ncbi:hypothetical protein BGY98DRAFT_939096 [Russula aff. rugulosa BPL654]|nr:hypothetical protein BGY98DRAFT_939096 [Russula aff. rugulosa BPL654]
MNLTPGPPTPTAQRAHTNPFPLPLKPPDPFFPPEFNRDDAAFHPETFLESYKMDYGGRRLELRKRLVEHLRGPLTFQHQCRFQTWNQMVAKGVTATHFRSAVSLVIAALDRGYYANDTETLLSTTEWAELACAVTAAAGRGLGATAEALQTYVEGDDQIASWLPGIEDQSKEILELLANNRVDEAVATWESLERACDTNLANVRALASELGYELVSKTDAHTAGVTTGPGPLLETVQRPSSPPAAIERAHPHPPNLDMNALTAAVQTALQPLMTRLEAVERASTRNLAAAPQSTRATVVAPVFVPRADPTLRTIAPQQTTEATPAAPHNSVPTEQEETWATVTKRKRRKGGKKQDQTDQTPRQINLTPRSYAATAPAAPTTDNQTPLAQPVGPAPPAVTEVTILRFGGSMDQNSERMVRTRQPDAIVGRWSSGTRSKGNFVFTMRGQIDFSTIQKFERFLTSPFPGGSQLCPNQGWTKLLAHGVPVMDNNDNVFGPDDLLKETRTMTGLRNAYFSSPPHWIKPVQNMSSCYSSLTFAFSDPDGSITKQLMSSQQALFGKRIQIESVADAIRWVMRPPQRPAVSLWTRASPAIRWAITPGKLYVLPVRATA